MGFRLRLHTKLDRLPRVRLGWTIGARVHCIRLFGHRRSDLWRLRWNFKQRDMELDRKRLVYPGYQHSAVGAADECDGGTRSSGPDPVWREFQPYHAYRT